MPLFVFEGADGAGKKTQSELLVRRLSWESHWVKLLHFPRYESNLCGKLIREFLDGKHGDFLATSPYLASLLYAVDRFESKDQLDKGLADEFVVVLDRYVSSNMIHQGAKIKDKGKRKEFLELLDALEHRVLKLPRPDLVIFLDIPLEFRMKLLKTVEEKPDNDQAESNLYHQRETERMARMIAHEEQSTWHRIQCVEGDKLRPPEDIHEEVWQCIQKSPFLPRMP